MLAKGESQRQVAEQIVSTVRAGYSAYRVTNKEAWDQLPIPPSPHENDYVHALEMMRANPLNNKSADQQIAKLISYGEIGDWENLITHGIYKNLDTLTPTYYRKEIEPALCEALTALTSSALVGRRP